jgi:hypothetical protein
MSFFHEAKSNYAFKPIAEQALRSNQTIVPQRLNAALAFVSGDAGKLKTHGQMNGKQAP